MQVWINSDDEKNVQDLAVALEGLAAKHSGKKFISLMVFMNPKSEKAAAMKVRLEKLAADKKIGKAALAYLSGPDDGAISKYKINTDAAIKNTVFVYKNARLRDKMVNLVADAKGLEALDAAVQKVVK